MRNLFAILFWVIPILIPAQTLDSASIIREVDSLIQASHILTGQRDFNKALEINAVAEKLAFERLGHQSLSLGSCYYSRGRILHAKGDYQDAEIWYFEALSIWEKALGRVHQDCAWILNSLGLLYLDMGGYYEKTEPLFLETLDIREKTLGKKHKLYAASLTNLANIYYEMGNYDKAKPLLLEALTIRETMLGKESPDYTQSLNNLANLYETLGDYKNAEALHLEALEIRERTVGRGNSDYLQSLNNLSLLYRNIGNYEKAEPLCREALSICESVLGKEHPVYPWSLDNLGGLYRIMGNFEKAETLLLEALTIREKVLGTQNPQYASSIENLALLYMEMANYKQAEPLFIKLDELNQVLITRAFHHLSEWELNNYFRTFSKSQAGLFSLAQTSSAKEKTIPQTCYDNCLFYKGFLLQAANQVKQLALSNSIATEKFNQLNSYRALLARQYAQPITERKGAEALESNVNNLEKDLTRTVAGYGEAMQQVKWQEVQKQLKPDEAAIEFVRYDYYSHKATDSIYYSALILHPRKDGTSSPKFVTLFEEKELKALLSKTSVLNMEYVTNLYRVPKKGLAKSLYNLIWSPLEPLLNGIQTIYFSPSGLLHRLNIGAIPIPPSLGGGQGEADEETLADRYRLVELGSTRQLAIPSEVKVANQDALLFGGIKYEMDSTAISQANVDLASETVASTKGELSFTYADSTLRGGAFNYLGGTEKEVTALEPILKSGGIQATTRRGYAATEEAFKTIGRGKPSPRILHIATHGFFFTDPKTVDGGRQTVGGEAVFKLSDHPMIRSGLILAGGNHAWQTGKPLKPDMEDGILTAYEISQMNLSNTELVVLSACETGLGDIEGNEGVYGLQRAFKIAGAKYLIMSMWRVRDYQTQELMTSFYKKWLEDKMTIPDAFRSAQKEMREKYQDPYLWAGFVLVE